MADPNPNPLGRTTTLEDEEKAMHKGRGRMIAGMVVAGLVAVGGLGWYMSSGDNEAYSKFGKNINGLDSKHFDSFWGCVFEGYNLDKIENNQDLRNQIHLRAERGGSAFGAHVRDKCAPILQPLPSKLSSLIPPKDMKKPVRKLIDSARKLRSAWSEYIAHLDGLEGGYERQAASQYLDRIARAWFEYRKTHSELNNMLGDKLGK
jgi:hypothetical protein